MSDRVEFPTFMDTTSVSAGLAAALLPAALDLANDALLLSDPDSRQVGWANTAACEVFGATLAQLQGRSIDELSTAWEIRRVDSPWGAALVCCLRLGKPHSSADATTTEPSQANVRDALTGLPLRDRLDAAYAAMQANDVSCALFFIDVDNLKQVNDRWGHLAGDRLLHAVAQRLTSSLRPDDLVARYGGDEFVALVAGVDTKSETINIVNRMRGRIREPIEHGDQILAATASIGITLCRKPTLPLAEAIHQADLAMYAAKRHGRRGEAAIYDAAAAENAAIV